MGSTRLPGKVLRPLAGRPALALLLDRLALATEVDLVGVATSVEPADDPVVALCEQHEAPCHRGPLEDLAARMLGAAEEFELDAFVRVNGDSPLLDPNLVDRAARLMRAGDFDLVTNVFPRSFPVGQSVEAIRLEAMRLAVAEMTEPEQREHVTQWFYEYPDRIRIESFRSDAGDFSDMVLALDTPEDAAAMEAVVGRMDRPLEEYGWHEIAMLRGAV
jgi:spore coat polysaccharide biosynthesis protein SpsF